MSTSTNAKTTKRPPAKRPPGKRPPAKRPPAKRPGNTGAYLWGGLVAVLVIVGVVAIALSRGGSGSSGTSFEIADSVEVDGQLVSYPRSGSDAAVGEQAPAISGTSPTGEAVTADIGNGQPTIVAFLAHSCPHCQAEVPRIVDLAESGGLDGVNVVAVTTGTSSELPNYPPSAWLENEAWPFPAIADTEDQQAAQAYGVTAYPFLVWIDGDGTVVGRTSGELGEEQLAANVAALKASESLPTSTGGPASSR